MAVEHETPHCSAVSTFEQAQATCMKRILAPVFATCCLFRTGLSLADDAAKQLAGTWKVVSFDYQV
jgi:hypothetical protein